MSKQWTSTEWDLLFPQVTGKILLSDLQYHDCIFIPDAGQGSITYERDPDTATPTLVGLQVHQYRAYLPDDLTHPLQCYYSADTILSTKVIMNFNFTFTNCSYLLFGFWGYLYPNYTTFGNLQASAFGDNNKWNGNNAIETTPDANGKLQLYSTGSSSRMRSAASYKLISGSPANIGFNELHIATVDANDNYGSIIGVILPITNDDASIIVGQVEIPYNSGDTTTQDGGQGTFTDTSDSRGDGSATAVVNIISTRSSAFDTAVNSGGFNVYQILAADMPEITSILFGNDYFTRFRNTMYNPLSAIISYHLLPSNLCTATQTTKDLKAGGFNISSEMTAHPQYPIMSPMTTYHVGKIDISRYFDAFPDFAPYTNIKLHLPYIGTVDIDPDSCMYGSIAVDYVCDAVSGNVAAWIWAQDKNGVSTWIATATGNAAYTLPMFSQNQDGGAVGKILGGIVQTAVGAGSGNAIAALGGLGKIASGGITAATHSTVISGNFGGNAGILCDTVCWVEITRPQWVNPENYQELNAIPSYIGDTIANAGYKGKTIISKIELDNIDCTDSEKAEIENILKAGIYIREAE